MSPSPPKITPEEHEQILQTIEMFEVIVQANPQDTQSLEILRDAYLRLGQKMEMLATALKLAETLAESAQFSAAMVEYEAILKHEPDNPEIIAAMGDVEERMNKAAQNRPAPAPVAPAIALDFRAVVADTGTLMTTAATQRAEGSPGVSASDARMDEVAAMLTEDGNEALAKFLIQNRLAGEEIVQAALTRVHKKNEVLAPDQVGASLIDEVVRRGGAEMETLLCGILERTKFAYIPLEYYEIDRAIVKMLPETITLNRLIVPFDIMSRTLMIATANPFDALGKQAVHQLLDYNIQWHLASPDAIFKVLAEAYKSSGRSSAFGSLGTPPSAAARVAVEPAAAAPELAVAPSAEPLQSADAATAAPLPDTTAFRLAPK
jgi:hypothetical protein